MTLGSIEAKAASLGMSGSFALPGVREDDNSVWRSPRALKAFGRLIFVASAAKVLPSLAN